MFERDQILEKLFPPAVVTPPRSVNASVLPEATYKTPRREPQDREGPTPCTEPAVETQQENHPLKVTEALLNQPIAVGRPCRTTRRPDRYGHNICERINGEPDTYNLESAKKVKEED